MNADLFARIAASVLLAGVAVVVFLIVRGPAPRRRVWLAGLRFAAALVLAVMLVQPQCRRSEESVAKPVVAVLVDDSQSMTDGPPGGPTRADTARAWLASPAMRKARDRCDLRFFAFGRGLRECPPDQLAFTGAETRFAEALDEWNGRWRDETAAAVLVLSDGLDTTGFDALPALDLPCSAVELEPVGAVASQRIALWQLEPPRRALAGAESAVRLVLQGWGVDGREIPVEWWTEGRKVGEKRVRFSAAGDVVETTFAVPPLPPGTYPFELRIPDEAAEPAARAQPFVLVVRQEGRSILLLENTLGFEGKFLRRALTGDRNIRLDAFTRWKDGGWAKFGDAGEGRESVLDLTPSALAGRAAVIVADVDPAALSAGQWQALADYVNRGGGLAVLGGPNLIGSPLGAAPIARTLPVPTPAPYRDGRFAVRMTEAGSRHAVFGPLFSSVGAFPALQSGNIAGGVAPNAQVLMEAVVDGAARPLVVVKQQGEGRVVAVLTDTLWRWRVAGTSWSGRLSPYDTIWTQLIDWLAPEAEGIQSQGRLELTTDRSFYRVGDKVELRAEWIAREPPPFASVAVTLADPGGRAKALALQPAVWQEADGRRAQGFRGEWLAAEAGLHAVEGSVAAATGEVRGSVRFAVAAAVGERRGEPADFALLRRLADGTGGRFFSPRESTEWLAAVPRPTRIIRRESVREVWNHPLVALAVFAFLVAEWWLRRRSGLP